MDKPAPKWLADGIPLLDLNDELDARSKDLTKTAPDNKDKDPKEEKIETGGSGQN
jgi:hypothetical protein